MALLVDTHAHLADPGLAGDLGNVLARAHEAGVVQVVAIATTADNTATVVEIAQARAGVFATIGIHPNTVAQARTRDWESVVRWARHSKVVAVGETGLDRYRDHTPFSVQQEWFDRHLALAHACSLPVIIHCRQSERDIREQLSRLERETRGVLHSFSGTWDDAQAFLELGLYLSFAGMITFANKNLDSLREAAVRVPADRILVETDSPYLSPHPYRGKPNEPGRVRLTAEHLAFLRGMSLSELAEITTANARCLFDLPENETL